MFLPREHVHPLRNADAVRELRDLTPDSSLRLSSAPLLPIRDRSSWERSKERRSASTRTRVRCARRAQREHLLHAFAKEEQGRVTLVFAQPALVGSR